MVQHDGSQETLDNGECPLRSEPSRSEGRQRRTGPGPPCHQERRPRSPRRLMLLTLLASTDVPRSSFNPKPKLCFFIFSPTPFLLGLRGPELGAEPFLFVSFSSVVLSSSFFFSPSFLPRFRSYAVCFRTCISARVRMSGRDAERQRATNSQQNVLPLYERLGDLCPFHRFPGLSRCAFDDTVHRRPAGRKKPLCRRSPPLSSSSEERNKQKHRLA